MKKVYTAPKIYFESFTMSTNIAGDCEVQANFNRNVCAVRDAEGNFLFIGGLVTACAVDTKEETYGYCYANLSENNNVFAS